MTSHQQIALDRVWLELSGDQETKQNKSVSSRILTFHQYTALDRVWLELSGDLGIKQVSQFMDFNISSTGPDQVWLELSDQDTKQNKSVSSRILTFHQQHQIGSGWNCPEIWTQNQTSWSFPQILTCHQQKALDQVWLELSGDLETKQVRQFTDFNIPSTAPDRVWLELSGDLDTKPNKLVISPDFNMPSTKSTGSGLAGVVRRPGDKTSPSVHRF